MKPITLCVFFLLCITRSTQAQPAPAAPPPVTVPAQPIDPWDAGLDTTLEGAAALSGHGLDRRQGRWKVVSLG